MDPGRWAPDTTLPPLRCHPQQLWAGPEAQVGQDRQGRGTCRRPPPSPPTGQSTPFCVPPQALTDVGSAFKAVTPPTTVQRRPHHQRHPEAQHPFPGAPAWLCCSLEPKLSQAQRFQVPSPHHVPTSPRAPGPAGGQQDPPSQADEELLSSHPWRLPQLWREEPVILAKINSRPTVYLS